MFLGLHVSVDEFSTSIGNCFSHSGKAPASSWRLVLAFSGVCSGLGGAMRSDFLFVLGETNCALGLGDPHLEVAGSATKSTLSWKSVESIEAKEANESPRTQWSERFAMAIVPADLALFRSSVVGLIALSLTIDIPDAAIDFFSRRDTRHRLSGVAIIVLMAVYQNHLLWLYDVVRCRLWGGGEFMESGECGVWLRADYRSRTLSLQTAYRSSLLSDSR